MINEIFEYYKQDHHLEKCLTYQDIINLKEIIKNENRSERIYQHLYDLLLLDFIDIKTNENYCINTDIYPFIKESIATFDLKKIKQRDQLNCLLIGMIKGYGIMNLVNLEQYIRLYNEIYHKDIDIVQDFFENRLC